MTRDRWDNASVYICADIFAPVCGWDGRTYGNACEAAANLAGIFEVGPCRADERQVMFLVSGL